MPVNVNIAAEVEARLVELLAADERFRIVGDLRDARVVITRTIVRVGAQLLDQAPQLEIVAQGTAGIDNIDLAETEARGVRVIHLPGVNANAVAELTIGHMIALTRTVPFYTNQVRSAGWDRRDCTSRHELRHYVLGIVGLGNVGSRVARLARGFGMRVVANDPYITDFGPAERVGTLEELLSTSDIVTMHVPLTDETRRMIDGPAIAVMRRGSFLINTARGEVVDVDAALAALGDGSLGGLAFDVFEPEPPKIAWPDDPRLIVTPHIAGCTHEAKSAAAELLYQRLVEWVETSS